TGEAQKEIDTALSEHRACARANVLQGDLHAQRGDLSAAVAAWQRIETQNPAFLALVADRFADAYRKLGDSATGVRLLRNYQSQYPSLDIVNALFSLVLEREGPGGAAELISEELERNRTLIGLDRVLEAQVLAAPADRRPGLGMVKAR